MKKEYVLGFLFDDTRRTVALIRKKRPEWQSGLLNGIGGKMEGGEAAAQAMAREFHEETGVYISQFRWRQFACMAGDDWRVFCFVAFGGYVLQSPTDEQVETISVAELSAQNCIPNLAWLIPLALDFDKPTADIVI